MTFTQGGIYMHTNQKNKAIVIGGNHYNTLGVIRSLGEKGVPVFLILTSNKNSYISKSKYITKCWQITKSRDEIIDILLNNFSNEDYKPVIIPTSDLVMVILDRNFNLLKSKYILPNIDKSEGKVTHLMNKKIMNEMAAISGLIVPKSLEIDLTNTEINIPERVIYPCIVKPLSSIDGKKEDIKICKDESELKITLWNLSMSYDKVLVQEYIDSEDSKMIEVIGCVTAIGKEVILPAIIEKKREFPLKVGSTSYALVTPNSKYISKDQIVKFLEKLNYVGVFDIEFKYANGKTYFIEINYRNGAPGYALTKMGVNIPYLWYLDASGTEISNKNRELTKSFNLMMEGRDFRHVLNGDLKVGSWIKDLINTNAFLFINFNDIKPIISKIIGR